MSSFVNEESGSSERGALSPVQLLPVALPLKRVDSTTVSSAALDHLLDGENSQLQHSGAGSSYKASSLSASKHRTREQLAQRLSFNGVDSSSSISTGIISPAATDEAVDTSVAAAVEGEDRQVVESESEEARVLREAQESELLVWRLMQEEEENAYRLQMEFMEAIAGQLSEEDRRALEEAMAEGRRREDTQDSQDSQDEDSQDGSEEGGVDVDNMDYEQLLELGEVIGDVKKEVCCYYCCCCCCLCSRNSDYT
jgi:hypothetical protein